MVKSSSSRPTTPQAHNPAGPQPRGTQMSRSSGDYLLPAGAADNQQQPGFAATCPHQQRGLAAACGQQDPGRAFIRDVQQLQHHLATYVQSRGAAATYEMYVPDPLPLPPPVPLPTTSTGTARVRRERKKRAEKEGRVVRGTLNKERKRTEKKRKKKNKLLQVSQALPDSPIEGSDGSGQKEKGPPIPDTSREQGNEDQKSGNGFRCSEDQSKDKGLKGNDEQSKGFKGYEDTGRGSKGSSDRWWGNGWQGYYENSGNGSTVYDDIGRPVHAQWSANNMSFEPGMGRQIYTNPGKGRKGYKDRSKGMKGYEYPSKGMKGMGMGFRRCDGSGKCMNGYEDLGPGKGWQGFEDYEVQGKGCKDWMESSASRLGPYKKW